MSNHYETLGVPPNATQEEIKKAYRNLIKKYHPDVYKSEDGEQKIREINQAYEIIGDEEKRHIYDLSLKSSKNQEEFNYDDLTEEQKKDFEFLKRQKTFENIVEKELSQMQSLLDLKSNLEINGLNGTISNELYYSEVVRLNNEFAKYMASLNELQSEAKKIDMYYIKERIDYVISTLSELIESLPLSISELIIKEHKQTREAKINRKINEITDDVNYNIHEIECLLYELNKKQISKIDYANFYTSYSIALKSSVSDIDRILELAKNDGLTELENLNILKRRCKLCLKYMDSDIEKTSKYADSLTLLKEIEKAIEEWFTIYKIKIDKIATILLKYPKSKHYEILFFYAEQIMNEQIEKLRSFRWSNTEFRNQSDENDFILVFMNKSYEQLNALDVSYLIKKYRDEFEKKFANLSLLRRLPCDVKYHNSEEVIPTMGKLLDLYRLTRFGVRRLPAIQAASSVVSLLSSLTIPFYCFATQNKELIPIELGVCLTIGGISTAVGARIAHKKADVCADYYYSALCDPNYQKILKYKKK